MDQVEVKFYEHVEDAHLKFAVIIAKTNGKWLFCKHKERDTYEVPGGHRENGETILDSKMSNEATYKVEKSEEPTPKPTPEPSKKGCNGGSYQAIWYVVSLLGLAVVLKKKRLF